jgi:hypothetical protein
VVLLKIETMIGNWVTLLAGVHWWTSGGTDWVVVGTDSVVVPSGIGSDVVIS